MNARTRTLLSVGHFGEQIAEMNVVAAFDGQRVQSAVGWGDDASIAGFFFERRDGALRLLHGERRAVRIESHAAIELLFDRGEAHDWSACFRELNVVRGEFVFRCGVLVDQALQSVVRALQAIALRNRGGKRSARLRSLSRCAAAFGDTQSFFGAEQLRACLRKLGFSVFHV